MDRTEFEKWAKEWFADLRHADRSDGLGRLYSDSWTNAAWKGWQAATAHVRALEKDALERAAKAVESVYVNPIDYGNAYASDMRRKCASAIRALIDRAAGVGETKA